MRSTKHLHNGMPSQTVVQVIGGTLGGSAAREGVTEAARRLSHALAEMVAILDTDYENAVYIAKAQGCRDKMKDVLKEWGVA